MVKETALRAIRIGTMALNNGELAKPAVEIPNKEVIGLAHTPTHAPLLQQANNKGTMELKLPVIDVQIDFNLFIIVFFIID